MNHKIMNRTMKTAVLAACFAAGFAAAQQKPAIGEETAQSSPATLTVSTYTAPPLPATLSAANLQAIPHISVTFHNTHTNADETYSGVRVADILEKFKAPLGGDLRGKALANYVVATGLDGYQAVLSLAEVDPAFHPGEVIVADAMNGKPLDTHNGPLKLVVTEDKRPARCVRNLVSVELKTLN
jgi:DMSO/TMAO reductase YedYZ molybdopterin-dependent catalytic subunit